MNPLPRTFSAVTIRQKTDVEALADSIERFARGGHIALWTVVELLPLLKPHHWAAYARDAGIPTPSAETIGSAIALYRQRIGYHSTGHLTPVHSTTDETLPGLTAPTKIAR